MPACHDDAGCPEGCLEANHPLLPTEATRAFLELVEQADNLCAVLTGHLHLWHTDALTPRLTQYVTNMGPDDCAAVFDLVP